MNNNIILTAKDLSQGTLKDCYLDHDAIVIKEGACTGIIESVPLEGLSVTEAVGTFNAWTDPFSSVDLSISLRTSGRWSRYFSYGPWGFGKINIGYDAADEDVRMNNDEILVNDGKMADALKVRIKLDRADQTLASPRLRQVCIACLPLLEGVKKDLPAKAYWEVPFLNQNMVPVIGGEMCSATTSAMLVMSKGAHLNDEVYPQRAMAHLVADAGHHDPTFGNWAFNVNAIGSFGFKSEFLFLTLEALKEHLAYVGPVGASIRGQTEYYHTNGHLIVVCGYEETPKGTVFIVNDPNINARFGKDSNGADLFVRIRMPEEVFTRVWRHAVYTIR